MKSIKQIVPLLVPATVRDGQNYDDLSELYGRLIGQWATELSHVADVVGGTQAQEKYAGQAGPRYVPNSRQHQKDAVKFLNENAFATPTFFLVDDILRKIEVEGAIRRINQSQARVLSALFNDRRLERLIEFDALAKPGEAYSLAEMTADVRNGIWSELSAGNVRIDAYRRELQRSYLAAVDAKLNPKPVQLPAGLPAQFAALFAGPRATSDIKAVFRAELRALDAQLAGAAGRATDRTTRAHIDDARAQVRKILDPED